MQSSKPSITNRLKDYFVASSLAVSLYLLINLILLSILNLRGLWNVFVSPVAGPINSQDISSLTNAFNSMQTKLDTPFVYLFWIFVGCIAYSVVLGMQDAVAVSKKEVRESHFLQAGESHATSYWRSALSEDLLLLTSAISVMIYVALYLRTLLPAFSKLFHYGLYNPSHYQGLADVLGSILASTVAVYIFILLCRVLRYHWHTIRPI